MDFWKSNRKYNIFTLKPTSEEDRELFWEFRCEDVRGMYHYIAGMSVFVLIVHLIIMIYTRDRTSLESFIWSFFLFLG